MATKDTNYLVAVHKGLDESLEKQVAALPEKFNKQRFLQNCIDRKSTRLNSSHRLESRMPSSA